MYAGDALFACRSVDALQRSRPPNSLTTAGHHLCYKGVEVQCLKTAAVDRHLSKHFRGSTCCSVIGLTDAIFCDRPKPPSLRLPLFIQQNIGWLEITVYLQLTWKCSLQDKSTHVVVLHESGASKSW